MLKLLFSSKGNQLKAYKAAVLRLYEHSLVEQGLEARISYCCQVLTELSHIDGALITASDGSGNILTYATSGLDFLKTKDRFETLIALQAFPNDIKDAVQDLSGMVGSDSALLSISLENIKGRFGALLVRTKRGISSEILEQVAAHMTRLIQEALQIQENALQGDLQKIFASHLTPEVPDTKAAADSLRSTLGADSITISLKEYEKFYLSATTNKTLEKHLANHGVTLDPVFKSPTVVQKIDGRETFEDSPQAKKLGEFPHHLLVVPMFALAPSALSAPKTTSGISNSVVGAIHITRTSRPFGSHETQALTNFGIILGTILARAWRVYLGEKLWCAGTEAVAISRYEPPTAQRNYGQSIMVDVDRAAEELFAGSAEQLRNRNVVDLYTDEDYRRISSDLAEVIKNKNSVYGPISIKIRGLSGSLKDSDTSYCVLTSPFVHPKTHYTISLLRDTSIRRRHEAQHKRLLELLDERGIAYFAADSRGQTVETSETETELTQYTEQELIGMQREDLFPDPGQKPLLFLRALKKDGGLIRTMQELRRKDGTCFLANGLIRLMKDRHGKTAGYEGLYENVTQKITLQELLDLPLDEVLDDHTLIQRFQENTKLNLDYMTSLSHQLRAPLGALAQNLHDFNSSLDAGDPLHKKFDYLARQTQACASLAENLSYIDRILRGVKFTAKRVNLAKMAIEAKLNFKHALRSKKLTMTIDDTAIRRVFPAFQGSEELFRQVLVNLTDNAIKYSKENTQIRLTAQLKPRGKSLEISNIGPPIKETERIFERGYRSSLAVSLADGTGLGLWIVQKIIDLHKGRVECSSQESTRFTPFHNVNFQLIFQERK